MGFGFTEEQELFRKTCQSFVRRELAPGAKERAKQEAYPRDLFKKVANMGWFGLNLPERYGGQRVDWVSYGIFHEELSRTDIYLTDYAGTLLPAGMALEHAPEELQAQWFPPLIRTDKLACVALTEPHCGSDAAALKTQARRDGAFYILKGEKTSITAATQADVALLWAKTSPQAGARGVTCFLVPLDLPGISRSRFPDMGFKPSTRGSISLDEVRIPQDFRVGGEGQGFYLVMQGFDSLRPNVALAALGAAQASLEEAISYAKQRTAFGRPIAQFEGISFKIAEHATAIEAARLLCYRALWLKDQGLPNTKEAAMAKWFGVWTAFQAIHDCLLIHGHFAYSEELPVEQRLRDVIGHELGDGPAEIMKLIISREILGKEFRPYS